MNYKKINIIIGWLTFLLASAVYLMTIEPTTSFWDCGEFISSAYKFEVGHPPGAPFFMLIGRFFTLFAGNDPTQVAKMINALSALASSFTILFLFWTITHLAKKVVVSVSGNDEATLTGGNIIATMGSGLVGALAYTFSDTFWFSAAEGEVYALSSLFTAVVFWAILKWENIADEEYANRWLILIAYLMGLSIGVHLLNLLAIPAIIFVYYFRKHKPSAGGILLAALLSMIILLFVQYVIIQRFVKLASNYELLFVNTYHMPLNSGAIIFLILILLYIILGIKASLSKNNVSNTYYLVSFIALNFALTNIIVGLICNAILIIIYVLTKSNLLKTLFIFYLGILPGYFLWHLIFSDKTDIKEKRLVFNQAYNLFLTCLTVIILGYSTYAIIIIRSSANPPMDQNDPEHLFSLLYYLNREQYGDRPLFKGEYYNAPVKQTKETTPTYKRGKDKKGRDIYVVKSNRLEYVFDERFTTIFPRMYSRQPQHISAYKEWGKIKGKPVMITNQQNEPVKEYCPTFAENLRFFFKYQIGHMYFRYFMWNFAGRQNDIQGHGDILNGNWISGIPFIDKARLGPQDKLPSAFKNNKARNTYYMFPFLLGLVGLLYHMSKKENDFLVVLLLFIMTGIAIVVYLNQYPFQPRERDYAYAGSFYAFAIWIGLGVLGIINMVCKKLTNSTGAILITLGCLLLVPYILAKENWDDHDRSGRYTARDFAYNYLNSCAPNAILFTNGDNDTFPLWYVQEVEEERTDIRVVNLSYLGADWYISQMYRKVYESNILPFSMSPDKFEQGTRDVVYLIERMRGAVDLKQAMDFVLSDNPRTKSLPPHPGKIDHLPAKHFVIPVDLAKVVNNGTVKLKDTSRIVKHLDFTLNKSHIMKNELMILDLLANNKWERPIYYAITVTDDLYMNLEEYFQVEGLAYRIVPVSYKNAEPFIGGIATDIMYNNMINKFKWGGVEKENVYLDENNQRMLSNFRNNFARLSEALLRENKKDSAITVLDKCLSIIPNEVVTYDYYMLPITDLYFRLGKIEIAQNIVKKLSDIYYEELQYYNSVPQKYTSSIERPKKLCYYVIQQLLRLLTEHNQKELLDEVQMKFENLFQPSLYDNI